MDMKKVFPIVLMIFLMPATFSQNANEEINSKKQKSHYNIIQFSLLTGRNSNSTEERSELVNVPSLTMTIGKINDKRLAIGVGGGFEMFDRNLYPLFVDFRYTERDNDVSPFLVFKAGYAFDCSLRKNYRVLYFNNEYYNDVDAKLHGGIMLQPETGVKIPVSKTSDLLLTVAYRYQRTSLQLKHNYTHRFLNDKYQKNEMNRLSFGIAIMFR